MGLVRLVGPPLYAEAYLAPAVVELLRRRPHVRVEADYTLAGAHAPREGVDLALRLDRAPEANERGLQLGSYQLCLVAAPEFLALQALEVPEALSRHAVLYGAEEPRSWWLRRGPRTVRVPLVPRLRVDSALAAFEAVVAGVGVSLLPELLVSAALEDGRLEQVLPAWEAPSGPIWAVYPAQPTPSPVLLELLEILEQG